MQAVILAGGLGTRLRPVTEKIPKCLAPVNGKPFLKYLLLLLKSRGITDIILSTGYLGEQVEEHFSDGNILGLTIHYSQERDKLLGTGGALKQAERFLDESFFVINGDTYLDIEYINIYRAFTLSESKALIVAYSCAEGERSDLEIDEKMIVTRYDKETFEHLGYVNAGVMMLRRELVSTIKVNHPISLEKEIFPLLIKRREIMAYVTMQNFYDIGTPSGLEILEAKVKETCR